MSGEKSFTYPAPDRPEANPDPNQPFSVLTPRELGQILGYEQFKNEQNQEMYRKIRPGADLLYDPTKLLSHIDKVIKEATGLREQVHQLSEHVRSNG